MMLTAGPTILMNKIAFIIFMTTFSTSHLNATTSEYTEDVSSKYVFQAIDHHFQRQGLGTTIENLRNYFLRDAQEYIVIGSHDPRSSLGDLLLVANGEKAEYMYLSTYDNRKVFCTSDTIEFNVISVIDYDLSRIENTIVSIDRYFTVIEKGHGGNVTSYAFTRDDNIKLREQINRIKSSILKSMIISCPTLRIEQFQHK